jgi:DNA-directed RNA polymerase subunit M/transcription elongation factor TFIIS
MNFCPDCENSLNTKITSDDNSNKIMSFVCNNCSYKKIVDISKEPEYKCVYKQNYNIKKIDIGQFNDKYLSKDPTLPHVDIIPCPNPECITNKESPNSEILDIGLLHILKIQEMEFHHRDPFDRILFSQAIVENMRLVSVDKIADLYFENEMVKRIW